MASSASVASLVIAVETGLSDEEGSMDRPHMGAKSWEQPSRTEPEPGQIKQDLIEPEGPERLEPSDVNVLTAWSWIRPVWSRTTRLDWVWILGADPLKGSGRVSVFTFDCSWFFIPTLPGSVSRTQSFLTEPIRLVSPEFFHNGSLLAMVLVLQIRTASLWRFASSDWKTLISIGLWSTRQYYSCSIEDPPPSFGSVWPLNFSEFRVQFFLCRFWSDAGINKVLFKTWSTDERKEKKMLPGSLNRYQNQTWSKRWVSQLSISFKLRFPSQELLVLLDHSRFPLEPKSRWV